MPVTMLGWAVGEKVCVHGEGFGEIIELVQNGHRLYAKVAIPRRDYHKPSRKVIEWTETVTADLDVYPPQMTRQQ